MRPHHWEVRFTVSAEEDFIRLADFLLGRAQSIEELDLVEGSISALRLAIQSQLSALPWSFRKAGDGTRTTRRELVVPAGASGYVALYEIESGARVQVLAVRHQLEQDYH